MHPARGFALANAGHDTRAVQAYLGHRKSEDTGGNDDKPDGCRADRREANLTNSSRPGSTVLTGPPGRAGR
jgi:hypothetical protein